MQSDSPDVDSYLKEVPEARKSALERIRAICLETLEGYEESMRYGMPSYEKDGVVEVAFASQKAYIALYVLKKEVLDRFRPALAKANLGKGCIRFSNPSKIDFDVVRQLLAASAASDAPVC